jgi:hypothetical protein
MLTGHDWALGDRRVRSGTGKFSSKQKSEINLTNFIPREDNNNE